MSRTAKATSEKVPCPECGKELVKNYVGTHMRNSHGISGGISGRARRNGKPTFQGFKQMDGFVLLEDDQGQLWIAERIR